MQVMQLGKERLDQVLATDSSLRAKFYKQMAINVTQRLQMVSRHTADIKEAPRGMAQPDNSSSNLTAKKLLKVRRRVGVSDTEVMAFMVQASMVREKRKSHGTLYVFESKVGFVTKVFGIKQQEVFSFDEVSEVLRESFTLKKEDGAVELILTNNKTVTFYPLHVEDVYDAIYRCRHQFESLKKERASASKTVDVEAFHANPHEGDGGDAGGQAALVKLLEKATLERYKAGDVIITDGSKHGTLFNIAQGRVAVEVPRKNEETGLVESVKVLSLFDAAVFGEMSFLNNDVACANVVAEVDTEVWQIKSSSIEAMLSGSDLSMQAAFYQHLATYLTHRVRQLTAMVGEALKGKSAEIAIEHVLRNPVFFAMFKRFLTVRKLAEPPVLAFLAAINDFLECPANGSMLELARKINSTFLQRETLISGLVSAEIKADVVALLASDTLPPRDMFASVLDLVLTNLNASAYRLFQQSPLFQPLLDLKAREREVPVVTAFKMLQILGEGYEGKVLQARKKDCGLMYALKVLDKKLLASRSRRWQLHCSRELQCLKECSHPYIVSLAYSFQTPAYLYMVQEYLPNNTMAVYLDNHDGKPVREDEIRFLVAQLVLALNHMHSLSILYRDLKPANVLLDDGGHVRVVDMGMASHLDPETGRRKSVCGTQRYMAPEMKNKEPYNASVDWYSLGKLILDCQGRNPYAEGAQFWESSGLLDLVDGLLIKDPTKRLGCREDGVRSIQRCKFFADVDWAALDAKKVPSPLRREWYLREPDVSMARQFRNGEDLSRVIEKLQHVSLDGTEMPSEEEGPGIVPDWDYVNPAAVYDEYMQSPYQNYKSAPV